MFKISPVFLLLLTSQLANSYNHNGITIDTGHTSKQAGAISATGINEYYYNLNMTNSISNLLAMNGTKINRVPTNLPNITLNQRVQMYPQSKLFVSIHHDSIPGVLQPHKDKIAGFSVFVSAKNPQFSKSLNCARHVANSLKSIGEYPSTFHSLDIPGERKKLLDMNGVYQYDNLVVLKNAPSPAILVEIGVISNPYEANRLNHPQTIDRIAKAIAYSISTCI